MSMATEIPPFAALTVYNGWSGKMCGQGKHFSIFILSVSRGLLKSDGQKVVWRSIFAHRLAQGSLLAGRGGNKTECGRAKKGWFPVAVRAGEGSDFEKTDGKILLRSNHGDALCGKEKMPKKFRKPDTRLRIFFCNIFHLHQGSAHLN